MSDVSYGVIRLAGRAGSGLRVLTYHRVTDAHPDDRLCVPVGRFAEQMRYLKEAGYRTVSMGRIERWAESALFLSGKTVGITFDDGFEDNFLYAFPEMRRYGFTGCFFVPSGFIRSGQEKHPKEDRPMTWAQMKEMLAAGQEIGGHSVTHRKLTQINISELPDETAGCKKDLEGGLGCSVDFFCYPAGYYNDAVKQRVKEAGYQGAFTVEPGPVRAGSDPFAMKRTEVSGFDSLRDFEKKLAGAYDWMHMAVQGVSQFTS